MALILSHLISISARFYVCPRWPGAVVAAQALPMQPAPWYMAQDDEHASALKSMLSFHPPQETSPALSVDGTDKCCTHSSWNWWGQSSAGVRASGWWAASKGALKKAGGGGGAVQAMGSGVGAEILYCWHNTWCVQNTSTQHSALPSACSPGKKK